MRRGFSGLRHVSAVPLQEIQETYPNWNNDIQHARSYTVYQASYLSSALAMDSLTMG